MEQEEEKKQALYSTAAGEDAKMVPRGEREPPKETFEPPPLLRAVATYCSYLVLYVVGLVGDFLRRVGLKKARVVEVPKGEVLKRRQLVYVCQAGMVALTLTFTSLSLLSV